jgi:hypothetical protein
MEVLNFTSQQSRVAFDSRRRRTAAHSSLRMASSSHSQGTGASEHTAGKQKAVECICTEEQLKKSMMFRCAFCCDRNGVKHVKTETDSEWDPQSPSREHVLKSVKTPQSDDSTATKEEGASVKSTPTNAEQSDGS